MINSDLCNMKNNLNFTKSDMGECQYDNGGYFIVKGSEKVIVSQERKRENKVYCFKQKLVQSKIFMKQKYLLLTPKVLHLFNKK